VAAIVYNSECQSILARSFLLKKGKALVRGAVRPLHRYFRGGKIRRFLEIIGETGRGGLLDVGGGSGISDEFIDLYKKFESVTVVNLCPPEIAVPGVKVRVIKADGRDLPFADGSFDWVFSNAVIEHVGGWQDQQRFAAEIRRVASKGYFVTTPNLYFPIEPHALLPLYQFYPPKLKRLALQISPGYLSEVEDINLLTKSQMKLLFPDANVTAVNARSSLIAFASSRVSRGR